MRTSDFISRPVYRSIFVCAGVPALMVASMLLAGCDATAQRRPQQETRLQQQQQQRESQPRQQQDHQQQRRTDRRTSSANPLPPGDDELAERIREGSVTMEEIAKMRDPVAGSPEEAIRALKLGNARFFGGEARQPEMGANERRAQILGQTPFAIILGCSDSRVPTEVVYDQALGSLFVVRVAGNIVEPATAGTVEYGVVHLKSHLIVVMGHEGCGAVAAALLPDEQRAKEPENVQLLLDHIRPAVKEVPELRDRKARTREAGINNVRLQVHQLKQNPTVARAIKEGKVQVVGAYYEIASGAVDFLESDEDLRLSTQE